LFQITVGLKEIHFRQESDFQRQGISGCIHGHGIEGNEQADKMAKIGAEDDQENNTVSPTKMKTIIKSLFKQPARQDSYHQLSRTEQVTIFRLRTGHCRLRQHMYQKVHLTPSPTCHCREADQTVEHILQDCRLFRTMREETWTVPVPLLTKLHGPVDQIRRTIIFLEKTGLQV